MQWKSPSPRMKIKALKITQWYKSLYAHHIEPSQSAHPSQTDSRIETHSKSGVAAKAKVPSPLLRRHLAL